MQAPLLSGNVNELSEQEVIDLQEPKPAKKESGHGHAHKHDHSNCTSGGHNHGNHAHKHNEEHAHNDHSDSHEDVEEDEEEEAEHHENDGHNHSHDHAHDDNHNHAHEHKNGKPKQGKGHKDHNHSSSKHDSKKKTKSVSIADSKTTDISLRKDSSQSSQQKHHHPHNEKSGRTLQINDDEGFEDDQWSSDDDDRASEHQESGIYDLPDVSQVSRGVLCKLFIASAIALIFLIIEVVGGIISGSLAILSDAAHMFSDLSGFFISIMSIWIGTRPASKKLSYGYHRAEVIGALGSIVLIWGLTIVLLYEATNRVVNKSMVTDPFFMLVTAIFGLVCNIGMAKVLHSSPGHSHAGHSHGHDHGHDHGHSHGHGHSHDHKKNKKQQQPAAAIAASKKNSHDHADEEELTHTHKHGKDEHDHKHGGHKHTHTAEQHSHKHGKGHAHKHGKDAHAHKHGDNHHHDDHDGHDHGHKSKGSSKKNLSHISEQDNYNLRAAMIHVIGDIIQSIGVVIAALLIYFYGNTEQYDYWHLADPICTYLFSVLVMFTTVQIVKDCIRVLMEGTPQDIEIKDFREQLLQIDSVAEIHDLHIWSLSIGKPAMSAHIFANGDLNKVLKESTKICRQHGIYHSTIQIEDWEHKDQPGYIKCKHNIHY